MTRVRFELLPPRNKPDLPRMKRRRHGYHWRALAVHLGKRTHLACAASPVRPEEIQPFLEKAEAKLIALGLDTPTVERLRHRIEVGLKERLSSTAADGGPSELNELRMRASDLVRRAQRRASRTGDTDTR